MTPADLRAMDRQVAEQVFGQSVVCWQDETNLGWYLKGQGMEAWIDLPCYTSDPAAWMQVVERMREEGFDVSMQSLDEGDKERWWNVTIGEAMSEDISLGVAICRAALGASHA